MKHIIKDKKNIYLHYYHTIVELLPDNDAEKAAINNLLTMNATDKERELVENYLTFGLGIEGYSFNKLIKQVGNVCLVEIYV